MRYRKARSLGFAAIVLALTALTVPVASARAESTSSSKPSVVRKAYDALVLRPFGAAQTLVGVAVWVPFYPVAALADSTVSTDARGFVTEACITDPVNQTFRKPLGEL